MTPSVLSTQIHAFTLMYFYFQLFAKCEGLLIFFFQLFFNALPIAICLCAIGYYFFNIAENPLIRKMRIIKLFLLKLFQLYSKTLSQLSDFFGKFA